MLNPKTKTLRMKACVRAQEGVDGFLEELIVRRELSDNFCTYEPNYDNLGACSDWAIDSLNKHRSDKREFIYTLCALMSCLPLSSTLCGVQ